MPWEFRGDSPIYAQLMDQLRRRIVSGDLPPGGRLPSVRDLAAQAGVNPNTMQRAMNELEQSGLIRAQRTSGRFVTEDVAAIARCKKTLGGRHIREFLAAMTLLGYQRREIIDLLQEEKEEES